MVTPQEVVMAYRLILGREPESGAVVASHCVSHKDLNALRNAFLDSPEFRTRRTQPVLPATDLAPPLSIDTDLDAASLQQMFARVEQCWRALGETEPYWSVVSRDQFKSAAFAAHEREFNESGKRDTERLLAWLSRSHIDPRSIQSCCEYGCGVGRVTAWLSAQFPHVIAHDISESHLRLAKQRLAVEGRSNVTFCRIDAISTLSMLEPVDLVMSIIVLQHNPPPVIAHIVRMLLKSLTPRGVAYFQVPTYGTGYAFEAHQYLTSPAPLTSFEMHVLPQSAIFQIARDEGCAALELQPDHYVGHPEWVSNTFLVQRRHRRANENSHD